MFFEDFVVGDLMRHLRGKTVTEVESLLLTHLAMNTAEAHFNEDFMKDRPLGRTVVFGGVTCSIVIGLTSEDVAYHAIAEIGLDKARFLAPVFPGDTLYAFSEVVSAMDAPDHADGGAVTLRHWGVNQDGTVVFEARRTLVVRRRPAPQETGRAPS